MKAWGLRRLRTQKPEKKREQPKPKSQKKDQKPNLQNIPEVLRGGNWT